MRLTVPLQCVSRDVTQEHYMTISYQLQRILGSEVHFYSDSAENLFLLRQLVFLYTDNDIEPYHNANHNVHVYADRYGV